MPYLPLQEKPFVNVDKTSRQGIAKFLDAAKDDFMSNLRRPGAKKWVNLGTGNPVDSLYEWLYQDVLVAISAGKVYKIEEDGTTTHIAGDTLFTGTPVSFASFGDTLFMANGGNILKWTFTNDTCSYIADADAPTSVTHIIFINQYLVALDTTQNQERLYYSVVDDPTTWEGDFFSAELQPDKPNGLFTGWEEILISGESTLENWYNSGGAEVFSRLNSSNTERGTLSPYTVQKIDNTYFFLDTERKVVRLQGRSPVIISNPFDRDFQAMETVSDARSMQIIPDGETFYIITFPTEGRTFAYDYKRDYWSEWSYWDATNAERDNYLGQTAAYMRKWDQQLVGSRSDGTVYRTSTSYYKDDTATINTDIYTGWNNYGTDSWKFCHELRVKLRRGDGDAFDGKVFEVWYRDNGEAQWKGPRHIDMGQLGEVDHIVRLRRLGRYRTRQWRFRCAEPVAVNLISAEEIVR